MDRERRGTERKTPGEPSYIQLGEDLGGIVCNVSQTGLAFQLATPLHSVKTIQTCISPNPSNQIDVTGILVWTDGTSRFGGLQFTEISAVAREQLRNWLAAISRSATAVEECLCWPKQESVATGWFIRSDEGILEKAPLQTPEKSTPGSDQPGTASRIARSLPFPLLLSSTPNAPWSWPWLPIRRTVAIAVVCCLLAGTPIVLLHYFRPDVARSLIRIGEKLQGSPAPSVTPPLPLSSGSTGVVTLPAPPTRPPAPRQSESFSLPSKPPIESTAPRGHVKADERLQSNNLSTNQDVPGTRIKRRGVNGRSAAAQALWNAVGRGDVNAEVALAELYVDGDGVPRSCEQARVLLRAALETGNGDAAKLLKHIGKAGCH